MITDSKHFPKIMFLVIIIFYLLIMFGLVNIMDHTKEKIEKKSITGYASGLDKSNNYLNKTQNNQTNSSESPKQEVYSVQSYVMYYVLIMGILTAIFLTFSILRSTVLKNIAIEEEQKRLKINVKNKKSMSKDRYSPIPFN